MEASGGSLPILIVIAIIVATILILFVIHGRQSEKRFCDVENDIDQIKTHLFEDEKKIEEITNARGQNGSVQKET